MYSEKVETTFYVTNNVKFCFGVTYSRSLRHRLYIIPTRCCTLFHAAASSTKCLTTASSRVSSKAMWPTIIIEDVKPANIIQKLVSAKLHLVTVCFYRKRSLLLHANQNFSGNGRILRVPLIQTSTSKHRRSQPSRLCVLSPPLHYLFSFLSSRL